MINWTVISFSILYCIVFILYWESNIVELINKINIIKYYWAECYLLILQDGSTSALTNYYKLAMLPQHTYNMALEIVELYEDGELVPPSESNQRQRRSISPSSFNFLRGLNPLDEGDVQTIAQMLQEWWNTGIRPSRATPKVHYYSRTFRSNFTGMYNMWNRLLKFPVFFFNHRMLL